jgi:hypothetical protein
MIVLSDTKTERGLTVPELARLLRIGPARIRTMIRNGELKAVDTSSAASNKPRYVVMPADLQAWQDRHQAGQPLPAPRKRRPVLQHGEIDFFPDD